MNPITIKPIASPFPPAMKILLLHILWLLLGRGNINYCRNLRAKANTFNYQCLQDLYRAIYPKEPKQGTRGEAGEAKGNWCKICALAAGGLPFEEHISGASGCL
jgi:hypothetical protein